MFCIYEEVCTNKCVPNSCLRNLEMSYLLKTSGIPQNRQRLFSLTPDSCDYDTFCTLADIKDNIKNFVDSGDNLYIVSKTTGNGKTSWAIKLMLKYFDTVWAGNGLRTRAVFVHVPTFLLKCKNFNSIDREFEDLKSILTTVDLVVWDDIGSTGMSNYDLSQLLMYIDQRVLGQKANIYTGNLMFEDLDKTLGSRLASRIWNTSSIAELRGKDKR